MKTLLLGTALLAVVLVACGGAGGEKSSTAEYAAGVSAGCYETTLRTADRYGIDGYTGGNAISDCANASELLTRDAPEGTARDGYGVACVITTLAVQYIAVDAGLYVPRAHVDEDLIALECVLAADARYGQ